MTTTRPTISLIAAVAENYTIGRDGDLPWRLPNDLKWFKAKTVGKPVVMGRKTYQSLGFPLPARRNIILTRDRDFRAEGCDVAHSLEEALALIGPEAEEVMILGGAGVYRACMEFADRFYLTVVHHEFDGDTQFPPFDDEQWRVALREHHDADAKNAYDHTFYILERVDYGPVKPRAGKVPVAFRVHPRQAPCS